jgi:hypothetical protein
MCPRVLLVMAAFKAAIQSPELAGKYWMAGAGPPAMTK